MLNLTKKILDILVCPNCRGKLRISSGENLYCQLCNTFYKVTDNGNVDLRLEGIKKERINFDIGHKFIINENIDLSKLIEKTNPEVHFDLNNIPTHLTKEVLSYFPKATSAESIVLDLGCGTTIHKEVCERAGFNYVGIDYENVKAPILGDAHSLPFQDNSIDFVLSVAVLEHIQYPFLMINEVFRVLQNGGTFIGSVAFLEPYHWESFYHYTHLGLINILLFAGFEIEKIAPNETISVFDSQARLNYKILFPRMPQKLASLLIRFPQIASNIWIDSINLIKGQNHFDKQRYIYTSSFFFVAKKIVSHDSNGG